MKSANHSIAFPTLVAIVVFARCAAADFVFEFRLTSLATHRNCFGDDLSIPCETYISQFCLRRSGETSGCSLGSSGQFGPGGSLPITRQIASSNPWPVSFQLYMKARDEDIQGLDDDLDDIFIYRSREPNTGFSQEEEYFGVGHDVSVRLSYSITCQTNFYGRDCATFCIAQNDDNNGHYTCNSDGSLQCRDGYENPSNNCRDLHNPCDMSPCANNGSCTPVGSNYTCHCEPDYTGSNCNVLVEVCSLVTCPDNSTCVQMTTNTYNCVCDSGFSQQGDECIESTPAGPVTHIQTTTLASATDVSANNGQSTISPMSNQVRYIIIGATVPTITIVGIIFLVAVILTFTFRGRKPHRGGKGVVKADDIEMTQNEIYGVRQNYTVDHTHNNYCDTDLIEMKLNEVYGVNQGSDDI